MLSLNYELLSREFYSGHPDGHPCYGQLTAVKKSIRSQVAPDCIADSSVQLIEVTCFGSYPLASRWFSLIAGSGP